MFRYLHTVWLLLHFSERQKLSQDLHFVCVCVWGGGHSPRGPKVLPIQNRKLGGFVPLLFFKGAGIIKKEKSKQIKNFLSVLEGPFQA